MKPYMRIMLFCLIVFPLRSFAQDFTGVWTGFIFTSNVRLQYELVISESNNKLKGYSLTVFSINNVENTGIKTVKLKTKKGKISIEDDELIFNDYTQRSKRVVLYSTLSYDEEDSILVLQGSFFTRSLDRSSYTGTIRLEKSKNFGEARMVPYLKKMDLWTALSIPESEQTPITTSTSALAVNNEPAVTDPAEVKSETTATASKTVNRSEVTNPPDVKKETIIVGTLPGGTTKPGVVSKSNTEVASVPKSVNKADVASLPEVKKEAITVGKLPDGTTKPGVVTDANTEVSAAVKPVNKSDAANLPGVNKEATSLGKLPEETTKPVVVTNSNTEVSAAPKPVSKSDVANLPGIKKESITVGSLPGGVAKPGIAPRAVAEDITTRKTEVIRSIEVQSDSLVLTLYDNGEIDGDTVSVVVNDRVIIARQVLGINAIKATVFIPRAQGDSVRLVMYAENLGRIPPNTGLLVVKDGDENYHIRFSGDYQKNSAVILRRKR